MTINIGSVSYGIGTVAFLVLAVLLATAWRGRLQGGLLLSVTLVSAVWSGLHCAYASLGTPPFVVLALTEVLRDGLLLAFVLRLLGLWSGSAMRGDVRWLTWGAALLPTALALWLIGGTLAGMDLLGAGDGVAVTALGMLGIAVIGLALVEQLYRNTRREHRWSIKLLCMGVGGLFAFDLFLYSNAMLVKQIDGDMWAARGAVNALVVPLLAVSAVRNPQWSLEVFVSRHVVFHSATLLGTGIYLTLMAATGYYIRLYGGTWGPVVQTVFLFGAGVLLVALLASGQIRARLRVLLNKHFFRNKYEYREEWLRFTNILSNSVDNAELRHNIIGGVASVVESPGGVMWIRQALGGFAPAATFTMEMPEDAWIPEEHSLVRFLSTTGWVVYIDEMETDPERYAEVTLPDWMTSVWRPWLVVPLLHGDSLEGLIVLARSETVRHLNWEDSDLLKTMGRQAATHLAMIRASEALADARQFEAFNRLSSYVVHDLKNVAAQLGLVTSNARKHLSNPEFVADAMGTVENATNKMNRMLGQLRKGRLDETTTKLVNVRTVLRKVLTARSVEQPVPELLDGPPGIVISADPERLAIIVEHIVQNAQEATPNDGRVTLRLSSNERDVSIEVSDTGCGMDAAFVSERLFKPFETTKGNAGMGIGVYESREFVQMCGGRMSVKSAPGSGTTFSLIFPIDVPDEPGRRSDSAREARR